MALPLDLSSKKPIKLPPLDLTWLVLKARIEAKSY